MLELLSQYWRTLCKYWNSHVLLPVMTVCVRFMRGWIEKHRPLTQAEDNWKERVLDDFRDWLVEIPARLPDENHPEMEGCDLYTLLTEFVALRQEIKFQNREQNRSLRIHETFIEEYAKTRDVFQEHTDKLLELEERIRLAAEKRALVPFLDIRDALTRGLESARSAQRPRGLFRRVPAGIAGVVEGYEMALRRFDRSMAYVGVERLITHEMPFDPKSMRAVERRADHDHPGGVVLEERLSGFLRGDEVIRTAEVVVNALPVTAAPPQETGAGNLPPDTVANTPG